VRVFLDANVLFSASKAGSNSAALIAWLVQENTAVSSDLAVEEARRNLTLKRADWLPAFDALLARLEIAPSTLFALPVTLAAKDAPLLCAAIRSRCQLFVTGDRRDFGHVMGRTFQGVEVVTPLRLAQVLAARSGT
jgi:predicted nucleic acid-binding protein